MVCKAIEQGKQHDNFCIRNILYQKTSSRPPNWMKSVSEFPQDPRHQLVKISSESVPYWRQNMENYPDLFYCFTYIFTMQASSVPSESLFSEAGDQVTDKRNRLDPDRVNKMMVIEDYCQSRRV